MLTRREEVRMNDRIMVMPCMKMLKRRQAQSLHQPEPNLQRNQPTHPPDCATTRYTS